MIKDDILDNPPGVKISCRCCEHLTIDARGDYDICPVCFWEDDNVPGYDDPSGANHGLTLAEGRENYRMIGACEIDMLQYVRPALLEEVPDGRD